MRELFRAAIFLGFVLPAVLRAEPPEVVSISLRNGDQEVSAQVTEIRVSFDQAMGKGASWVGQGDFIAGPFKWVDDKTCVLPVKLKPGTDYRLSINSKSFTYFRSTRGEPVLPHPFSFRTAGGVPAPVITPQLNRRSIEQLRAAIESAYSYRDRVVKDWDTAFAGRQTFVLMGPANMSSCESFLRMLKLAPNATLVGAPSYGSSGNPKPHTLANGVVVFLPTWQDLDERGKSVEGIGIEPDVSVATEPEDFDVQDPVLVKAMRIAVGKE